jgi:hypothetical protein
MPEGRSNELPCRNAIERGPPRARPLPPPPASRARDRRPSPRARAGERNRQQPGSAAQIHHAIARLQPHDRNHPLDQALRVAQPEAGVIGHRGAETARIVGFWRGFRASACALLWAASAYISRLPLRAGIMATIALVDDDKNILASVTMLLEQEGYHVRAYSDGARRWRADRHAARPRHPRHQDAPHGRAGAAAPPAPARRPAGHLPHLQGRGDRRADGAQCRRRRLYPQALLAAPAARAGEGGAAPRETHKGRRRPAT